MKDGIRLNGNQSGQARSGGRKPVDRVVADGKGATKDIHILLMAGERFCVPLQRIVAKADRSLRLLSRVRSINSFLEDIRAADPGLLLEAGYSWGSLDEGNPEEPVSGQGAGNQTSPLMDFLVGLPVSVAFEMHEAHRDIAMLLRDEVLLQTVCVLDPYLEGDAIEIRAAIRDFDLRRSEINARNMGLSVGEGGRDNSGSASDRPSSDAPSGSSASPDPALGTPEGGQDEQDAEHREIAAEVAGDARNEAGSGDLRTGPADAAPGAPGEDHSQAEGPAPGQGETAAGEPDGDARRSRGQSEALIIEAEFEEIPHQKGQENDGGNQSHAHARYADGYGPHDRSDTAHDGAGADWQGDPRTEPDEEGVSQGDHGQESRGQGGRNASDRQEKERRRKRSGDYQLWHELLNGSEAMYGLEPIIVPGLFSTKISMAPDWKMRDAGSHVRITAPGPEEIIQSTLLAAKAKGWKSVVMKFDGDPKLAAMIADRLWIEFQKEGIQFSMSHGRRPVLPSVETRRKAAEAGYGSRTGSGEGDQEGGPSTGSGQSEEDSVLALPSP